MFNEMFFNMTCFNYQVDISRKVQLKKLNKKENVKKKLRNIKNKYQKSLNILFNLRLFKIIHIFLIYSKMNILKMYFIFI